jgi:hypothetical protein
VSHQRGFWSTRSRKDGVHCATSLVLRCQTSHFRTSTTPKPSEDGSGAFAYSPPLRSPSASLWQDSFYCTCVCASDTDLLLERWDPYTRPSKFPGSFNATLNVFEANAPSLVHQSAWKGNSANFVCIGFSEGRPNGGATLGSPIRLAEEWLWGLRADALPSTLPPQVERSS